MKDKIKPTKFHGSVIDLNSLTFNTEGDKKSSVIEVFRTGKWSHPWYGEIVIDRKKIDRYIENFNNGVIKALPVDIEHKSDEGAYGWFSDIFMETKDGVDVLMAKVDWTDEGIALIKSKKYRFFSAEITDSYEDAATGEEYKDVLLGGAITNRPFFQELEEITLSYHMRGKKFVGKYNKVEGGEIKMTKEEILAKLKENPEWVPTEEDKVDQEVFDAAVAEVTEADDEGDDADDEGDDADEEGEGDDKSKEGGEGKYSTNKKGEKIFHLTEDQLKKFQFNADQGVKAAREIRNMKREAKIDGLQYSMTSKTGVLLPKDVVKAKAFARTLGNKQYRMFMEILEGLPELKLFSEIGGDENDEPKTFSSTADELDTRAKKLMAEQPEVYKQYSQAVYKVQEVMKQEGKKLDYEPVK